MRNAIAATRRDVGAFGLVALLAAGGWAGWGFYGAITVAIAFAVFLFWRAFRLLRQPATRTVTNSEPRYAVSRPMGIIRAEWLCRALEREGIHATFPGRADLPPGFPGVEVSFALVQVMVLERDIDRANEVFARLQAEMVELPADEQLVVPPDVSQPSSPERDSARAAFGLQPRHSRLDVFRRRRD